MSMQVHRLSKIQEQTRKLLCMKLHQESSLVIFYFVELSLHENIMQIFRSYYRRIPTNRNRKNEGLYRYILKFSVHFDLSRAL